MWCLLNIPNIYFMYLFNFVDNFLTDIRYDALLKTCSLRRPWGWFISKNRLPCKQAKGLQWVESLVFPIYAKHRSGNSAIRDLWCHHSVQSQEQCIQLFTNTTAILKEWKKLCKYVCTPMIKNRISYKYYDQISSIKTKDCENTKTKHICKP